MTVFMFPGQSSADPRMISRIDVCGDAVSHIVRRTRAVLGAEADHYLSTTARLACNRDVQISVFIATQMRLAALADEGIASDASFGLSLGEYSHLVHIGALSFEDGLRLVAARGAAYDRSPRGVMVTVIGPEQSHVEAAVRDCRSQGVVTVSNYNSPTQHVIAGEADATHSAAALLEDEGAQAIEIESRVAMHSPLLNTAACEFKPYLERTPWAAPRLDYWPNVTGAPVANPSPQDFVAALTAHVSQPVQWRRTVERMAAARPDAIFVEVGPGMVLHNMLSRRWLPVHRLATDEKDESTPGRRWRDSVEALRARG